MKKINISRIPKAESGSSIETALVKLAQFDSSALLVMESDKIVGIFTERDFARIAAHLGQALNLQNPVDDGMYKNVIYVSEDHRLEECMSIMSRFKIRHLPVLKDGKPIALLSMRHIMEALVEEKDFMIGELTKYITGSNFLVYSHGNA